MEKIFLYFTQLSVKACAVIPLIIAVRFLIRKQPKSYSYALWAVVFFGLVVDFQLPPPKSITVNTPVNRLQHQLTQRYGNALNSYTEDVEIYYTDNVEYYRAVENGIMPVYDEETEKQYVVASARTQQPSEKVSDHLPKMYFIWLAGILALAFMVIKNNLAISARLKYATKYEDNIYTVENIPSPFVFGILKPAIYIPETLRLKDLSYIIAHEQVHIRRKDHIIKPLCLAITVLHWFNPLVWLAFRLLCHDMEMSCDEKVISRLGTDNKKAYSMLLLDFATDKSLATTVLFGESHAENRIKNVLKYRKPAKIAACVLTAVVVVCFVLPLMSDEINTIPPAAPPATFYELLDSKNNTDSLQYKYRMGIESPDLYRQAGETVLGSGVLYELKHRSDTYTVPELNINIGTNIGLTHTRCLGNRIDDGSRPEYSVCALNTDAVFAIYDYKNRWSEPYILNLPQGYTAGAVAGHDKFSDSLYITSVTAKDRDGNWKLLIYHTKNGTQEIVYDGQPLNEISTRTIRFLNENVGFASCRDSSKYPTAKITLDGGRTWQSLDFSALVPRNKELNSCNGCIVNIYGETVEMRYHTYQPVAEEIGKLDDSYAVISTDGGLTWAGYARGGTRQTGRTGIEYIKVTEDVPVMLETDPVNFQSSPLSEDDEVNDNFQKQLKQVATIESTPYKYRKFIFGHEFTDNEGQKPESGVYFNQFNDYDKENILSYEKLVGVRVDDHPEGEYISINYLQSEDTIYYGEYLNGTEQNHEIGTIAGGDKSEDGIRALVSHDNLGDGLVYNVYYSYDKFDSGNKDKQYLVIEKDHKKDKTVRETYTFPVSEVGSVVRGVRFLNENLGFMGYSMDDSRYAAVPKAKVTVDSGKTWYDIDFSDLIYPQEFSGYASCCMDLYGETIQIRLKCQYADGSGHTAAAEPYYLISYDCGRTWGGYMRTVDRNAVTGRAENQFTLVTDIIPLKIYQ